MKKPDWAVKAANRLWERCYGDDDCVFFMARALRAARRRGQRDERSRSNTCHVCKISMYPEEHIEYPYCIDCGGCDEDKCSHLYTRGRNRGTP